MNISFDVRIFKFGLVGLSGMLADFAITWLLKEKLHINKFVANAAGFSFAVTSNFLLNNIWTFAHTPGNSAIHFLKFLLVSLSGLLLNYVCLQVLVKYVKANFYLLKLFVTGIVFFWNYFLNIIFTFA